jgi:SAM-dependent methyltransferase
VSGERRLIFGSAAEAYEQHRPEYPTALFDDVLAFAELGPHDRVLEVGAGTGKATRALLARGLDVTCVEPDAEMAGVLRRTSPQAHVVVSGFEAYDPQHGFGLLCSAQAWHWVEEETRGDLALRALRPGGTVALFWNLSELPDALQRQVDEVYARREPALHAERVRYREPDDGGTAQELAAAGFLDVERRDYGPSGPEIDADDFQAMVATTSAHLLLPDERRRALLAEVGDVIRAWPEALRLASSTMLWLARAPG